MLFFIALNFCYDIIIAYKNKENITMKALRNRIALLLTDIAKSIYIPENGENAKENDLSVQNKIVDNSLSIARLSILSSQRTLYYTCNNNNYKSIQAYISGYDSYFLLIEKIRSIIKQASRFNSNDNFVVYKIVSGIIKVVKKENINNVYVSFEKLLKDELDSSRLNDSIKEKVFELSYHIELAITSEDEDLRQVIFEELDKRI